MTEAAPPPAPASDNDAATSDAKNKKTVRFEPSGRLGVQIVLGLALVLLVLEAIAILAIALTIPAAGPRPGTSPFDLPELEGRGPDGLGAGETIGHAESFDALPGRAPQAEPLTARAGDATRLDDGRLQVAIDLVCASGCRLQSARVEIRSGAPGCVIEGVEFHGPPGSWQPLAGDGGDGAPGATIHLDHPRGVWISPIGGWALALTLRLPAETPATLPLHVTFATVRPPGLPSAAITLPVAVPPAQ